VALVISTGPPQVAVPAVAGLTQAAATTAITTAGLTVGAITQVSSLTPAGIVISSTPVGGTLVAPLSAVALLISTGPPTVAVPTVAGLTQAPATAALLNAGLTLGTVSQQSSATVLVGRVISSTPVAGTLVAPGSAVALVISTGPAPVLDPTQVSLVSSQGAGVRSVSVTTATPGVLLVAFVGADGPVGANGQSATVAGGAGLTWTRARQQSAKNGVAEIWTARAANAGTYTITSTVSNTLFSPQQLTVVGFTNVSAVGAVNGTSTPGAAAVVASTNLVTLGAGSVVYAVGLDWATLTSRTVGAGQTRLAQSLQPTFIATWVQRLDGVTGAAGSSITLNTTTPTSNQWNMAIIELRR
jgi:beta-lactam-binding protein with PASTA domain